MVCTNSTCLNGGVCVNGLVCACPPGWLNDNVGYYHSQDCSLPSSFLEIFFIVYTIVTVLSIGVIGYYAKGAMKLVKQWKFFYWGWLIIDWIAVLAVYLEGGFFAAACVLTAVYSWVGTAFPTFIVVKILAAYFKLVPTFPAKAFSWFFKLFVVMWNAGTTGILIAAAVHAKSDDVLYNRLIISWFLVQGFANVVFLSLVVVFFQRLTVAITRVVSNVEGNQQSDPLRKAKTEHAVKRLNGFKTTGLGILPFSSVNIIVGFCLLALPSVPYL